MNPGYFEFGLSKLTISCHFPASKGSYNCEKITDYWMQYLKETIPSHRVKVVVLKGFQETLEDAMHSGDHDVWQERGILIHQIRHPRHRPVVWTW